MATIQFGLLPAAGKGIRAYPATNWTPKALLEIAGKPLIQRNLEIMRDQLGVREIFVILGHLGQLIRDRLGSGETLGVKIHYLECEEPEVGLARGILLAEPHLNKPFVTILPDEFYLDSNHRDLAAPEGDFFSVCGVMRGAEFGAIRKNYSVFLDDGQIVDLEEKPEEIRSDLMGCGTYLFTPDLFRAIRETAPSPRSGQVELTDVIAAAARHRPECRGHRQTSRCSTRTRKSRCCAGCFRFPATSGLAEVRI